MRKALAVLAVTVFGSAGFAQAKDPLEGSWVGTLQIPGTSLRMVMRFEKATSGEYTVKLDSPDQQASGIPGGKVTFDSGNLKVEVPAVQGSFEGKLSEDGAVIAGKWKQGGQEIGLELRRGAVKPSARPQIPKPPFPYKEIQVEYQSLDPKVKLAGTLAVPKGKGPHPAALLITGSGAQNRDEEILGHKPFWVLSDYLARRGIAVLRVDDRGVGGSTGNIEQSTSIDFAQDVLGGVAFLEKRKEIDPKRIGLIGHSEGGIIAPMAAVRSARVSYIVLLAGTGMTGAEILYRQAALISRAGGAPEASIALNKRVQQGMFEIIRNESDNAKAEQALKAFWEQMKKEMSEADRARVASTEPSIQAQLKAIMTPWFRSFLFYDPIPTLKKVKCPVLALNGEKDLQVPASENLAAIAAALKEGGNRKIRTRMFPGLNHLFQTCTTGSPSEYATIEETFAPVALKEIGDWIAQVTKKTPEPKRARAASRAARS